MFRPFQAKTYVLLRDALGSAAHAVLGARASKGGAVHPALYIPETPTELHS